MESKQTLRGTEQDLETTAGQAQRSRPQGKEKWSHLQLPVWGIACDEAQGKHPEPWGKGTGSTQRNPLPSMCIAFKLDTMLHQIISKS